MTTNRRSFLASLAALAGTPPALASIAPGAGAVAVVLPPIEVPRSGAAMCDPTAEAAVLRVIAQESMNILRANLVFGNMVRRRRVETLASLGDRIQMPLTARPLRSAVKPGARNTSVMLGNLDVTLTHDPTRKVALYDVEHAMRSPEALWSNLVSGPLALVARIDRAICSRVVGRHCEEECYLSHPRQNMSTWSGKRYQALALVTARQPLPISGCGAIGTYVEEDGLCLRVVMGYDLAALAQVVYLSVLFGIGEEVNA